MKPTLIVGGVHTDVRGTLRCNNAFDASAIKRMIVIENVDTSFVRAWQGHKIEQRWFSAVQGGFTIRLIAPDNWETPFKDAEIETYELDSAKLDILHIPSGYISSIRATAEGSRLLVMSNYAFNEIVDEYRFPVDYFG